jgi:hypothetical protein
MKNLVLKSLCACACLVVFSFAAAGQQKSASASIDDGSVAATMLRGTGKVVVIGVGSAGHAAWVTTKFVAKKVALPAAKTLLLKVPEKTAIFGLKTVRFSLKKGAAAAGKIGFAYLKTKLP